MTLDAVSQADRRTLVASWKSLFGEAPPNRLSAPLMRRFIAFEVQARDHGGLPKGFENRLAAAAQTAENGAAPARLKPGGRLLREWNGASHIVDVLEDGYRWRGRSYRSLSAVARAITGARWSGPRFFGVKTRYGR